MFATTYMHEYYQTLISFTNQSLVGPFILKQIKPAIWAERLNLDPFAYAFRMKYMHTR